MGRLRAGLAKTRAILTNHLVLLESAPRDNRVNGRRPEGGLSAERYRAFLSQCEARANCFAAERFRAGATWVAVRSDAAVVSSLWVTAGGGVRHWCLETGRFLPLAAGERVIFDLATPEACRGRGFAELATRVAQELFAEDHLIAYVDDANGPSLRVFDKCGFRRAGSLRWNTPRPLAAVRRSRHG